MSTSHNPETFKRLGNPAIHCPQSLVSCFGTFCIGLHNSGGLLAQCWVFSMVKSRHYFLNRPSPSPAASHTPRRKQPHWCPKRPQLSVSVLVTVADTASCSAVRSKVILPALGGAWRVLIPHWNQLIVGPA